MTAVNESDISRLLGPVLASGSERVCVQNLENPLSCFKISKFGPSRQTASVNFQRFSTPYPEVA